jgi:type I restriction enzyme S subunit
MQTYQSMKDSGVAWLGMIPTEWELTRAKFFLRKIQEKPLADDEVVTAFRDGEVILRKLRREDGFTFADKEIGYQHVSRGDLVVHAMDAFAGAIGVSKSDGKMSPVCSICQPKDSSRIDTKYLAYLLRAMTKTNYLVALAKGIRERSTDFRYGDLGNMLLPVPSYSEQQGIVQYIDEETAKIDSLVTKQECLLELLEEKRRASITDLVTHGLNSHVIREETNLPWLGRIPSSWELKKVKYAAKRRDQKLIRESEDRYIGLEHVESFTGRLIEAEAQSEAEGLTLTYKEGDVLFGKLRPYLAKVLLASDNGVCSSEFIVLKAQKELLPKYLKYSLLNQQFVDEVNASTYGSKMPRANWGFIGNIEIPIPSLGEQESIVQAIEREEKELEALKQSMLKQIELLKERRASLISSAVTGKMKI